MDVDGSFEQLWNRFEGFELGEARPGECPYAREFARWTQALLEKVSQAPDIVVVNQAKLQLQDKWWEWRRYAPRSHRERLSGQGHVCLFQVYSAAYERLRLVELSLTPPFLFLPSPPPPPPPPRVAGFYLLNPEGPG